MNTHARFAILVSVFSFATLACGLPGGAPTSSPEGGDTSPVDVIGTIAPMDISGGIEGIDVCAAISKEAIESARGMALQSSESFAYYDTPGSVGCQYNFGKSADNEAFFGYVALTPASAYDEQPLYLDEPVTGLGDKAYFSNGADARQLWVKFGDQAALVVAFGDVPQEARAMALAKGVVAAIKR